MFYHDTFRNPTIYLLPDAVTIPSSVGTQRESTIIIKRLDQFVPSSDHSVLGAMRVLLSCD